MINWKRSAELNNTSIDELKARFEKSPGSHKEVIAICDNTKCGKERVLEFRHYRNLCKKCAARTPENREHSRLKSLEYYKNHPKAIIEISKKSREYWSQQENRDVQSERSREYWSHQENRDVMSKIKIQYYIDNPDVLKIMSERTKQYHVDHPELAIEHSKFMKDYYSHSVNYNMMVIRNSELWTEERCEAASERMKIYLNSNPKVVEEWKERMANYWDETNRNAMARLKTQYYRDNPEVCERISATVQGIPYEEWNGFSNKSRSHLIPIHACIQINNRFEGSVGHHIASNMVIFIPAELHRSISHNMKTGKNMMEINNMAWEYWWQQTFESISLYRMNDNTYMRLTR